MTRSGRLWAPWRLGYITRAQRPSGKKCLFCQMAKGRPHLNKQVITRGRFWFTVLNRFPYINGHLLIAPYRHIGKFSSLTEEEWWELFGVINDSLARLKEVFTPAGYNLGINLGKVAGAGIPGHFHLHIVPRWLGDTNFMPVTSDTRVISQSLASAHRLLTRAKGRVPK